MWLHRYDTTQAVSAFDVGTGVALVILAVMLHGVWRLWRGMRRDAFELGLQALRHRRPGASISFPRRRAAPADRAGLLQLSLLPLMLVSSGLAILLAQAQRPDDMGRSVTWLLFVSVASWYGTWSWSRVRGIGPLRNFAWGGVWGGIAVSALLWGFYLAVDSYWGDVSYSRLTASTGTLLWWTAMGGVVGALVGSFRANLSYSRSRLEVERAVVPTSVDEVRVESAPRTRRRAWGMIAAACVASALFHCSAAPHLNRLVEHRYWVWDWHYHHSPNHALTLTMAPATWSDLQVTTRVTIVEGGVVQPPMDMSVPQLLIPQTEEVSMAVDRSGDQPGDTPVAVAARDIAPGVVLTPEMFRTELRYEAEVKGYLDPNQVAGRVASRGLARGEVIRDAMLPSELEQMLGSSETEVTNFGRQALGQVEELVQQEAGDAFEARVVALTEQRIRGQGDVAPPGFIAASPETDPAGAGAAGEAPGQRSPFAPAVRPPFGQQQAVYSEVEQPGLVNQAAPPPQLNPFGPDASSDPSNVDDVPPNLPAVAINSPNPYAGDPFGGDPFGGDGGDPFAPAALPPAAVATSDQQAGGGVSQAPGPPQGEPLPASGPVASPARVPERVTVTGPPVPVAGSGADLRDGESVSSLEVPQSRLPQSAQVSEPRPSGGYSELSRPTPPVGDVPQGDPGPSVPSLPRQQSASAAADPTAPRTPGPHIKISLKDGRVQSGFLRKMNAESITISTRTGQLRIRRQQVSKLYLDMYGLAAEEVSWFELMPVGATEPTARSTTTSDEEAAAPSNPTIIDGPVAGRLR